MHFSILTSFYVMFGLAIFSAVLMPLIPKKAN
jgi:hypothetical protein